MTPEKEQSEVKLLPFNLNGYVSVKLTEHGKKIHYSQYEELVLKYRQKPYEYKAPETDSNGWSKWQLWDLIKTFGQSCYNGCALPFETEIRFTPQPQHSTQTLEQIATDLADRLLHKATDLEAVFSPAEAIPIIIETMQPLEQKLAEVKKERDKFKGQFSTCETALNFNREERDDLKQQLADANEIIRLSTTDPTYEGGAQFWIKKHDEALLVLANSVKQLTLAQADNARKDEELKVAQKLSASL